MHQRILFLLCFIVTLSVVHAQDPQPKAADAPAAKSFLDEDISLTREEVDAMILRYKNKRWKRQRRFPVVGKKFDAGSCWFDIKKLWVFTDKVNEALKKRKILSGKADGADPVVSGYRFYYILYGKNDPHAPNVEGKTRLYKSKKVHTLLIVPTEERDGIHYDILDGLGKQDKVAALLVTINPTATGGVENEGTLCPPLPVERCKGATLGGIYYQGN